METFHVKEWSVFAENGLFCQKPVSNIENLYANMEK